MAVFIIPENPKPGLAVTNTNQITKWTLVFVQDRLCLAAPAYRNVCYTSPINGGPITWAFATHHLPTYQVRSAVPGSVVAIQNGKP